MYLGGGKQQAYFTFLERYESRVEGLEYGFPGTCVESLSISRASMDFVEFLYYRILVLSGSTGPAAFKGRLRPKNATPSPC